MRERPQLRDKILTKGSWDFELVDLLSVEPGDLIVPKARYSGFTGTNLDLLLRERDIRTLIVTGIASNVCVELTIRDALFREYFCVFVHDAAQQSGPEFVQQAVIYNVETFLGWVSDTNAVCNALRSACRVTIRSDGIRQCRMIEGLRPTRPSVSLTHWQSLNTLFNTFHACRNGGHRD